MKKTALVLSVIGVFFFFVGAVVASDPTPSVYQPPHPYPEPGSPDFPEPGHFMRESVGFTVDEINDQTKYFRSQEFINSMKDVRDQAQQALAQQLTGVQLEANFATIHQKAIDTSAKHLDYLSAKRDLVLAKDGLNDHIGKNIDTPDDTIDSEIKTQVAAFFNLQITYAQTFLAKVKAAKTMSQLQALADEADAYVHDPGRQTAARSLASRVFLQTILHFSSLVQGLVVWVNCLVPQLGKMGFDVTKHITYISSPDSLFNTDWYSQVPINADPKYRPWASGSFGAKKEYQLASDTLANPNCQGSTSCKDETAKHMRLAKYMLQDMFHIFYWGYDNIMVQIENGAKPLDNGALLQACPVPQIPGMRVSGQDPGTGWPSKAVWPTGNPTGGANGGRLRGSISPAERR